MNTKNKRLSIWVLSLLLLCIPSFALAEITIEVLDKDTNDWGFQGSDLDQFSFSDCETNVEFDVTVTQSGYSGSYVYLFYGSSCGTDTSTAETCLQMGDSVPSSSTSIEFSNIKTQDIFNDDCSETSQLLWVKVGNDNGVTTNIDDNDTDWSDSFYLTYDSTGPSSAPEGLNVLMGSQVIEVSWDELDTANEYIVIYWEDSGANVNTSEDGGIKTGSNDETCEVSGGFAEGDDFNLDLITDLSEPTSATNLSIKNLTNGLSYNFAVIALDEAGNPSPVSEVLCAIPNDTTNFWEVLDAANGNVSDGQYCFIATAAFGSYNHPIVKLLRVFRDSFLTKMPYGQNAIKAYYKVGPTLALVVNNNLIIKNIMVALLSMFAGFTSLIMAMNSTLFITGIGISVLLGLFFGAFIPRHRRQ